MFAEQAERIGLEHSPEWFDRHREVLSTARADRNFFEVDEIERHICWSHADPGDVIISTAGIFHSGNYLTGPRYCFVSTYAQSDRRMINVAVKQSSAPKFRDYHEYLLTRGFLGSADVLQRIDQAQAS